MFKTVTIVGVGLIGGSFSLALKDHKLVQRVLGVSRSGTTAQKALELGIIDEVLTLEEAVKQSDLIYVAIPVDATLPVMKTILDMIRPDTDRGRCRINQTGALHICGRSSEPEPVCSFPPHVGNRIQRPGSGGAQCISRTFLCDL